MKTLIRSSFVIILGTTWLPAVTASLRVNLREYDIDNIRDRGDGKITREAVEQWLTSNSGDFQSVTDFSASIEDGEETIDIPWSSEDNEASYLDTLGSEF